MKNYKNCVHYCQEPKGNECMLGVVDNFSSGRRYNCKKNGVCAAFQSVGDHLRKVKERKELRDQREYIRLKKKYEGDVK